MKKNFCCFIIFFCLTAINGSLYSQNRIIKGTIFNDDVSLFNVPRYYDGLGLWKVNNDSLTKGNLNYDDYQGSLVRVAWNDIIPKDTKFKWDKLDAQLKVNSNRPIILLVWIWNADENLDVPPKYNPKYLYDPAPQGLGFSTVDVYKSTKQKPLPPNYTARSIPDDCGDCNSNKWKLVDKAPPFYSVLFQRELKRLFDSLHNRILFMQNLIYSYGGLNKDSTDLLQAYFNIKAIQPCFGSTGDFPSYKGKIKVGSAALDSTNFFNYFTSMSVYCDSIYKDDDIHVLHNPGNDPDSALNWLLTTPNLHNPWFKMGNIGHGYQLNGESRYYDTLKARGFFYHPPNIVKKITRGELSEDITKEGWWKNPSDTGREYRNMFALLCNALHFNLDISNQPISELSKDTNTQQFSRNFNIPAYNFYNKYMNDLYDTAYATSAFSMLRDGLDASDLIRFPENAYGSYIPSNADSLRNRFRKIVSDNVVGYPLTEFNLRGARLERIENAISTADSNRVSDGINDVGDHIIAGNYERYLHQMYANETSVGYWNVKSSFDLNTKNSIYGRYARGFDTATHKNKMYFNIDDSLLNNTDDCSIGGGVSLYNSYNGNILVTYLDSPGETWYLRSMTSARIIGIQSFGPFGGSSSGKKWRTDTISLCAGNFFFNNGNARSVNIFTGEEILTPIPEMRGADFYIFGNFNTKFALVEISLNKPNPTQLVTLGFEDTVITILNPKPPSSQRNVENRGKETSKGRNINEQIHLNIIPNPVKNKFSVGLSNNATIKNISIYNSFGQIVFKNIYNDVLVYLNREDISDRVSGYYILTILSIDNKYYTKKIYIQ